MTINIHYIITQLFDDHELTLLEVPLCCLLIYYCEFFRQNKSELIKTLLPQL